MAKQSEPDQSKDEETTDLITEVKRLLEENDPAVTVVEVIPPPPKQRS